MDCAEYRDGARAAVIGASGGIGGALADALETDARFVEVLRFSRSGSARLDVTDEASIAAAAERAGELDLIVVATGLLHDGDLQPEKALKDLDADRLARSFAVNAIGPALVAKHFLPLTPRRGRRVFAVLSARVGSIADNRAGGWYGYRASKAALNMMLRNVAIETGRRRDPPIILALQPGTVDTAFSKPFQGSAKRLFSPAHSAAKLLEVIHGAGPDDSGGLFDWSGERLPY
jgi:NAD(P)-dependent dehydrogenase (short-subunit alcohol dehydrogenase family)